MKLDEHPDSDLSDNEEQYSNLANAVSQLDNTRRVKAPTRKELSSVVSEFYLPKGKASGSGDVVNVNELTKVLRGSRAIQSQISKVESVIHKAKTLPKPLEKPVAERIQRAVGYKNVKGQLKKWNAVVEKNRAADHLSFPLQQGRVSLMSSQQFFSKFKSETPLEIEMSKILEGTKEEVENEKGKDENENLEFPLTLEEMMEKRKELAQFRAKMSYQEAKAHRQGKIKSKKYHRILKREKVKQQLKEFEQLQKTDPEAALKKLEELDRNRALERASLRHKNTGKWAKNLAVRAKYNKESRKILAEQLKLSRDLTEKVKNRADSDDDASEQGETRPELTQEEDIFTCNDNPWAIKVSSEVSNFVSDVKKYWEDKNKNNEETSNGTNKGDSAESANSSSAEKTGMANGVSENSEIDASVGEEGDGVQVVSPLAGDKGSETQKLVKNKDETATDGLSVNINGKNARIVGESKRQGNEIGGKSGENDGCDSKSKNEVKSSKKSEKNVMNHSIGMSSSSEQVKKGASRGKKSKDSGKDNKSDNPDQKVNEKTSKARVKAKIPSTSGPWTVEDVVSETKGNEKGKRKNAVDIDDLFDDLDDRLTRRTSAKLAQLKKQKAKAEKSKRPKRNKEKVDKADAEDLSMKKNPQSVRPDLDEELTETAGREPVTTNWDVATVRADIVIPETEAPPEIDPQKFIEVKPKKLNTKLPDDLTGDDNFMDDEEATHRMNIVEAFNDDDVMEEFKEMKKEEEETTKLEVPSELPGWGSWGGAGVQPEPKKKRMLMVNVPKLPPRKDHNRKDIIIKENANPKIIEHLVKDVPHPFGSVGAFESNLRHPVGREWIPETAHRKFIKKPVETQMGAIIEPMDENELLRLKNKRQSLYKGKKKGDNK